MNTSLSIRIAGYFGTLFMAAMAALFALWYFGLPLIGLTGAGAMQLAEVTRALEQEADHRRALIHIAITERRGDTLVIAENRVVSKQLQSGDPNLASDFERVTDRLHRAYPDRYQDVLIVDPASGIVRSSTQAQAIGQPYRDMALIERARLPGIKELVEQVDSPQGTTLAIVRQMFAPDADGYPNRRLVGILITLISPRMFFPDTAQTDTAQGVQTGSTYLLDSYGNPMLPQSTDQTTATPVMRNTQVVNGFEGTLQGQDADGKPTIAVYRHIRLSGNLGWTLVHHMGQDEALAKLKGNINTLLLAGLLMTLLALAVTAWAAYRLTLPLRALVQTARQVGQGKLSARVPLPAHEAREIMTLAQAFNDMADSVEQGHHSLEAAVLERTLELAGERDRAQGYLDIAGVMLLALNADGSIAMVNAAGAKLLGYSESKLIGMNWFDHFIPSHQRADMREVFQSIMRGETELFKQHENDIVAAFGAIRTMSWNNALLCDDTGHPCGTLSSAEDITERKIAEEEIRNLAFYDPLTGLPNRRLLMDRLGHAMASAQRHRKLGALLFVDLDHFKTLNDTLGHDKGDLLLEQVAARLRSCIRGVDTVARLGGDEFVVLLEDLSENPAEAILQAQAIGEKILATLNHPYVIAGYSHHSSPSIGITLLGEHVEAMEEPLKRADVAMYQAKAAGRNTLRFFDPQTQVAVAARADLETALREAVQAQQLVLHYQAQVTADGRIVGAEALVRWTHPQQGVVSPATFIALAEETGIILALGHWVLETACTQLQRWASMPGLDHLTLAVNVSACEFLNPHFVDQVLQLLQSTGAKPSRLKLELTESLLVANVEDVIAKMNLLKKAGIGFSLDDFGTGYSSLSYLKRLPLDQLKIDQGFVRDILVDVNDAAIAKMVVALADSMGLNVIAEGVETQAQRNVLEGLGCLSYQGYLFSKPLALDAFESFARAHGKALQQPDISSQTPQSP